MRYLLDTNVLSELRKREGIADRNVVGWAAAQDAEQLFVSVISVMELDLGIRLVERRDPAQGKVLRTWLDRAVLGDLADRILPVSLDIALRVAALHVPNPRPERDAYLAATALSHGLTMVTHNVADFEPTGVPLLNPWQPPG
ncbi:MAG: type II toxin-antitoxin system VapC family toxin [Propionicimonas sp.]